MAHPPPSKLLSLPAELRIRIWELAIGKQEDQCRRRGYDDPQTNANLPPLFQVSRQIRREVRPIFLETHTPQLNFREAAAWFEHLGDENTYAIRRLEIFVKSCYCRWRICKFYPCPEYEYEYTIAIDLDKEDIDEIVPCVKAYSGDPDFNFDVRKVRQVLSYILLKTRWRHAEKVGLNVRDWLQLHTAVEEAATEVKQRAFGVKEYNSRLGGHLGHFYVI